MPQATPPPQRQLTPLNPPMLPFALVGTGVFAIAGLVLVLVRGWLARHGHTGWLWICVAGFLLGIVGVLFMIRHDARRRP